MVEKNRLSEAFEMANWLHRAQTRKLADGEKNELPAIPYISHLLEVLAIVIQGSGDEDQQIAALLHDAIEDQNPGPDGSDTKLRILETFGERVLEMVQHCTDGESTIPRTPETWVSRKEEHIEHIGQIVSTSPDFLLVSLADKLSNVSSIVSDLKTRDDRVWGRFNTTPDNLKWYYSTMFDIYQNHFGDDHQLVKRLSIQMDAFELLVAQRMAK